LGRIETFGSKKEVKTYTDQMREEIRRSYVESVYGKDKADLMLQELEHGLSMQKWQHDGAALEEQVEVGRDDNDDGNDGQGNVDDAAASEMQSGKVDASAISDEELEATFEEEDFQEAELAAELVLEQEETQTATKSDCHDAADDHLDTHDESDNIKDIVNDRNSEERELAENEETDQKGNGSASDEVVEKSAFQTETGMINSQRYKQGMNNEMMSTAGSEDKDLAVTTTQDRLSMENEERGTHESDQESDVRIEGDKSVRTAKDTEKGSETNADTSDGSQLPKDETEEHTLVMDSTQDSSALVELETIVNADDQPSSPVDDSLGQSLVVDATQDSFVLTNETETVMPSMTAGTEADINFTSSQHTTTDNIVHLDDKTETSVDQEHNTIIEEAPFTSQIHFVGSDEDNFSANVSYEETDGLVVDDKSFTQQTNETATVMPSMTGNTQFDSTQQSMDY